MPILILFPILLAAYIISYVFFNNVTNHSGTEFMDLLYPLAIYAFYSLFKFKAYITARIGLALCLMNMFLLCYIDHNNYMVQYERWLKRGLPEKGEPAENYFQWLVEDFPQLFGNKNGNDVEKKQAGSS